MIKQLKNLTEKERNEFEAFYKQMCDGGVFLRPSKEFDGFGSRFPIDYLNKIGLSIIFLPVEIMAEYVDKTTKQYIDENSQGFIQGVIDSLTLDNECYEDLNTTSVGNVAYCYVYSKNDVLKGLSLIWLNFLHKIEFDKMLQTMKEFYGTDVAIN